MEIPATDRYNQLSCSRIDAVELTVILSSGRGASPVPEGDRTMDWDVVESSEMAAVVGTMPVVRTSPSDDSEGGMGEVEVVEWLAPPVVLPPASCIWVVKSH